MTYVFVALLNFAIIAGAFVIWKHGYWCGQRDEARHHVEMLRRKLPL